MKDYIINGADKLFCQYGCKSVTMDDIAKQLAVSKKTIYQNFKDKNELINILIEDRVANQKLQMESLFSASENAVQELYSSLQNMDCLLATMNPMLFYDLQKYHQDAWLKFSKFKEVEIGKSITNNLERGKREGFYRKELNTDLITRLRLDEIDVIFRQNENYDTNKYSLADIMVEITRHFLFGICNNEGIKLIHKYDAEALQKEQCTEYNK